MAAARRCPLRRRGRGHPVPFLLSSIRRTVMITRIFVGALLPGLLLAGCAAPALQPDGADHPANPEAPAAAVPPHSQTLAVAGGPALPATAPAAYSCPHHPEVVSDQPGNCPKCDMALTPKP